MKNKNLIYIVLTGVIAVTLIWLSQKENKANLIPTAGQEDINQSAAEVDSLEGILWNSDNQEKGNLMLVSKYTTVYLRTSRDFSNLIGKNVIAKIDGTLENFTLTNIEENISKDGFIKAD